MYSSRGRRDRTGRQVGRIQVDEDSECFQDRDCPREHRFAVALVAVGVVEILRDVAIIGGPCETPTAQLPAGVGPYALPVFDTPGPVNGTVLKALAISPERARRGRPRGTLDSYRNGEEFLRAEHSTW